MVLPDMFPKFVVSNEAKHEEVEDGVKSNELKDDVKPDQVKDDVRPVDVEINVGQQFTNEKLFTVQEHILEWVRMVVGNLGFNIVIGSSDNGSSQRQTFLTMRCERSGSNIPPIQKLKRDGTR
ncbi:uncharacterized protein LOC131651516 [Vicia villosa]|uniref:uncharacterized protein LOC131651516 n=1 Tax=Vicia villosa TaxID=3911 RepID=UPI00273AB4DE|nr:uncharacterized protein LOC131651516 [Vicia villosa]